MQLQLTLEYWPDEKGYVGRLREAPAVMSQGDTLEELEENIRDAYALVLEDEAASRPAGFRTKRIELEIPA